MAQTPEIEQIKLSAGFVNFSYEENVKNSKDCFFDEGYYIAVS